MRVALPIRPSPSIRPRPAGRGVLALGFWLAGALLLAAPAGAAPQAQPFQLVGSAVLKAPVRAVAISADESMIAAATAADNGANVTLIDRRSGAPLGNVHADVGDGRRLAFSPRRDALLVWGQSALELWNISVAALKPGEALGETHRIWRQAAPDDAPIGQAAFARVPESVVWSAGARLYRRGIGAKAPLSVQPLLESGETLGGFATAPGGEATAIFAEGSKTIQMVSGEPPQPGAVLKGHRFPVAAVRYAPVGGLLSLDTGRNLIAWQGTTEPKRIDFLKAVPDQAKPAALFPLSQTRVALLVHAGGAWTLAVLEGAERKPAGALVVTAPPGVALSATGRYVATADKSEVKLYAYAHPIPPVDYVRRLRDWGAMPVALSYARQLDPDVVTPAMRHDLEQELNRVPSERVLAELLQRMREAVEAEDPAAIEQWAEQVLALRPGNPEAVAAMGRIQGLRERQVLAEAREAYEGGSYRRTIDLLANRIPPNSEHAAEAEQLIHEAERRRDTQTTLVQARERMEAGLYDNAEALVNEALRREPENRDALLLQSEIRSRSGGFMRQLLLFGAGIVLALALIAFVLHRYRHTWRGLLRPLSLDQQAERQTPLGAERPFARAAQAHARTGAEGARPAPGRPEGGRPALARALRMEEARRTFERTEQLLRLCRQADRYQEHTAYFLELEAELNTMTRRLNDPHADPEWAIARLQKMLADLRGTKFKAPPGGAAPAEAEPPDHYQLLRVSTKASEAEIKTAYHRLLKEYHPDRHNTSEYSWVKEEAERMTRRLAEAYQVLSDANRREQYDRDLARRRRSPQGAAR